MIDRRKTNPLKKNLHHNNNKKKKKKKQKSSTKNENQCHRQQAQDYLQHISNCQTN